MNCRVLTLISFALITLFCSAYTPAQAEEVSAKLSAEAAQSKAITTDALERIKRARQELEEKKENATEEEVEKLSVSSVAKNSMYFFALLLIGFSVFKKFTTKATTNNEAELIEVVSRKALSTRTSLMIVQIENQKLLLSQNGDDVQYLTELSQARETEVFSEQQFPKSAESLPLPTRKAHG